MTKNDSTSKPQPSCVCAELLTRVTALCNELDQLMILHDYYFTAAESLRDGDENGNNTEKPRHAKLPVFPSWLKEREMEAIETLYKMQETLRECQ